MLPNPNATKAPPPAKPAILQVAMECPEIGEGWTQQLVRRKGGKRPYRYYFSPEGKKFVSLASAAQSTLRASTVQPAQQQVEEQTSAHPLPYQLQQQEDDAKTMLFLQKKTSQPAVQSEEGEQAAVQPAAPQQPMPSQSPQLQHQTEGCESLSDTEERGQTMVIQEHEATAKNVAVKEGEPSEPPPNNNVQERVQSFASRISELEGLLVNAKEDLARETMIRELEEEMARRNARDSLIEDLEGEMPRRHVQERAQEKRMKQIEKEALAEAVRMRLEKEKVKEARRRVDAERIELERMLKERRHAAREAALESNCIVID